jgi:HEPN domain-containing protein
MALDLNKQVDFWRAGAADAFASGELLIANGRWSFGLFLLHLSIEKALKALVVQHTREVAPRTHDLLWLARRAELMLPDDLLAMLGEFQVYCLAGRYPDSDLTVMDRDLAQRELTRAREAHQWLQNQFNK